MTKRTLQGTKLKRSRTSGFRSRIKTSSGRRILKARRTKGRYSIAIK
jgi:large subunit ribosomal protein L34